MKALYSLAVFCLLNTVAFNLKAQLPTNGLIGEFLFNGNANDLSGNCNNGFVNGAILTEDRFGRKNSAYSFDANLNSNIRIPYAYSLQTSEFSYSVWCELTSLPDSLSQYFIIANGSASQDQFINAVNQIQSFNGWNASGYNLGTPAQYILNSNKDLEINKWVHLVLTRSSNGMKLYVNNKLAAEDNTNYDLYPDYGSSDIFIGMRSNYTYGVNGKIDDIRIYNRAINETEIDQLYNEQDCYLHIISTDTLLINANISSISTVTPYLNIKVYPNPTLDHIIIDAGNISYIPGYSYKIINTNGIEVYRTKINKQLFDLDTNKWLGKGLYFLYLYDSKSNVIDVKEIILQ